MKLLYLYGFVILVIILSGVYCEINGDNNIISEKDLDETELTHEREKRFAGGYRGGIRSRISRSRSRIPVVSRRRGGSIIPVVRRRRGRSGSRINFGQQTEQMIVAILFFAIGLIYTLG